VKKALLIPVALAVPMGLNRTQRGRPHPAAAVVVVVAVVVALLLLTRVGVVGATRRAPDR